MRPDTAAFGDRVGLTPNGRLAARPRRPARRRSRTCSRPATRSTAPTDITRAVGEGRQAAHMIDALAHRRYAYDGLRRPAAGRGQGAGPRPPEGVRVPPPRRRTAWRSSPPRPTSPRWRRRSPRPRPAGPPAGASTAPSAPSATSASRPARSTGASTCRPATRSSRSRWARSSSRPASSCSRRTSSRSTGTGVYTNVITGMQMDRLLAPTRPFNTILRPGDGKVPERIAYILCTGSRDETVDNPLCSRFCCMYSIKQNQLLMGALPAGRRHRPLHGHPGPGQALRRVLRAGEGDGRHLRQGPRRRRHARSPTATSSCTYEDIENGGADRRGRVRPRRPGRGRPAQPRRRAAVRGRRAGHGRVELRRPSRRRT